jgi:hypothetical protein
VLELLAQIEPLDRADLACQGASFAREVALYLGVGAVAMIAFAYFYRDRAAAEGLKTVWTIASLLLGVLHVFAALWFVPLGCLTSNEFTYIAVSASPWALAAMLFRSGLPPPLPPIVTDDARRDDPFNRPRNDTDDPGPRGGTLA